VLLARRESTAWREGVAAFWVLSIGASISLIAQTYNLGGDFGGFMLTWTLLSLPIVYLLSSSVATALYWVGVTTWAVNARVMSGVEVWFWPLIALAAPQLWRAADGDRYHPRVSWLIWVLAICLAIGTGASLEDQLSHLWIVVYASLFTVMWLAGRRWFDEGRGPRSQPLQSLGAIGMAGLSLLLTFKWPWEDLVWHTQWRTDNTALFCWRLAVVALWPLAAMCLWGAALRKRELAGFVAGLMPLLAAIGVMLGGYASPGLTMPLVFDVFLLAVGAATVLAGIREQRLSLTNGGMLLLSVLIIVRFFDSNLDFVVRGLAFVAVGIGFLVTNFVLIKKARVAQ